MKMASRKDDLTIVAEGPRAAYTKVHALLGQDLVEFPSPDTPVGQHGLVRYVFDVCEHLGPAAYNRIALHYTREDYTVWLSGSFVTHMKRKTHKPEDYYMYNMPADVPDEGEKR